MSRAGLNRLADDLLKWSRKLENSGYGSPTDRDVLDFQATRKTALWLMRDMRPDIERRVGGRTLDEGRGRRARGYRAGVWAAPYSAGGITAWWVGGTGKLHWLDQGTSGHWLKSDVKQRRNRRTGAVSYRRVKSGPMPTPQGVRMGPFWHRGAGGDSIYWRSRRAHQDAAMRAGGTYIQDQIVLMALPAPATYQGGPVGWE